MKLKLTRFLMIAFGLMACPVFAQDISLFEQFSGRYDFIFIGNTLNTIENNSIFGQPSPPCTILTGSSAALNLGSNDVIQSAYLYWAGSGSGDFNVKLNGQDINAQRTFNIVNSLGFPCFAAFADVTTQVTAAGNANYTLSDLDLSAIIDPYCPSGSNFGGWAIVVIYRNLSLPLNQINVYDGMQAVVPNAINITLNNLNVIDNAGAKVGFVAWEGDKNIAVNETLAFNGNVLQNALNPPNNAFNGTNSFTNSSQLFNMDLDVYDIQNNINIGDTSAQIRLTSGQDFVMINCVVTKLNSQLPDATIVIDRASVICNSKEIIANYTVYNVNSTNVLPANVPIAVYANGILIATTQTQAVIAINGSESGTIALVIPDTVPDVFDLSFTVDDDGTAHGIVIESDEGNNRTVVRLTLATAEAAPQLNPLISCNKGLTKGIFDLSGYANIYQGNTGNTVTFYASAVDLQNDENPITDTNSYQAPLTPMPLFVKIDNGNCYTTATFLLITKKCPPTVYNYVSVNNDNYNPVFFIEGLRDVFTNFRVSIYNRWGKLVWTGDNNAPDWDGFANKDWVAQKGLTPTGTYFYAIELNDPDYPEPLVGFLYLNRS